MTHCTWLRCVCLQKAPGILLAAQPASEFCAFCKKRVYIMERMSAEGVFFHRGCLKCDYCATSLRLTTYACDRQPEEGGGKPETHFTNFYQSFDKETIHLHIFFFLTFTSSFASYFSFQPVLHDWCSKGRGMCYPVCGMVHIKEPLLLIGKSSLCGGRWFPFSLSEWSLTICLTPNNRK